jgi:hypothetical protein
MTRQSTRTGRTFSTSSIQRDVIQAQGHSGSNQNCMSSGAGCCSLTTAAYGGLARPPFPGGASADRAQGEPLDHPALRHKRDGEYRDDSDQ